MEKEELIQYRDLKREIVSLEHRIQELQKNNFIQYDRVTASNTEFPYQKISLEIEGIGDKSGKMKQLYQVLHKRQKKCENLQLEIESFISNIPDSRTRRVFEMRYIKGWNWQKIAFRIGKSDESYPRKEIHDKYLNTVSPISPKTPK